MQKYKLIISILFVLSLFAAGTTFAAEVSGAGSVQGVVGGVKSSLFDDPGDVDTKDYCEAGTTERHPEGVKLADELGADYEDIIDLFCKGLGFGEIRILFQVSQTQAAADSTTALTPAELFEMYGPGVGWGKFKQAEGVSDPEDDKLPDEEDTGDTEEVGEQKTAREVPCTGIDPHPEAQWIADNYGADYEDVIARFCSGYGFGEIKLAYDLAEEAGVPVDEIYALRDSGLGWGEIKQQYNVNGNPHDDQDDLDNEDDVNDEDDIDDDGGDESSEEEIGKDKKEKDNNAGGQSESTNNGRGRGSGGKP